MKVPNTAGARWSFQKLARRSQDWAIVGVALQLGDQLGIGLVNMAPQPTQAVDAEAALSAGASPSEVRRSAYAEVYPTADLKACLTYRRHVRCVLVVRRSEERLLGERCVNRGCGSGWSCL